LNTPAEFPFGFREIFQIFQRAKSSEPEFRIDCLSASQPSRSFRKEKKHNQRGVLHEKKIMFSAQGGKGPQTAKSPVEKITDDGELFRKSATLL
jgi:hypothetical protein